MCGSNGLPTHWSPTPLYSSNVCCRGGHYQLSGVALMVKAQKQPADSRWWNDRWVIGDPSCRFNARSPLLRCAVLPEGPCERCSHYSLS